MADPPKAKLSKRLCLQCEQPLAEDAHPNRRFCLPCAKQRRRLGKARRPVGRPSACTPERIRLVCEAAVYGAYQRDIARHVGISETGLTRWLQRGHDAMVDAGIDPEVPPDGYLKLIPERERPYAELRAKYLRARARGVLSLLQAQHKAGVGGPVYADDPNALKPEEYTEIAQVLSAAGRSDLVPALRRPQKELVGHVEPDPRAAAKALSYQGYTEKQQVELSGEVKGAAAPSLCVFFPPEDTDDE
jgi:hypothetical protein